MSTTGEWSVIPDTRRYDRGMTGQEPASAQDEVYINADAEAVYHLTA
jgi:hypothetical protein